MLTPLILEVAGVLSDRSWWHAVFVLLALIGSALVIMGVWLNKHYYSAKFPDTIIYFHTPVDTILKRIKRRRRKFELKHYSAKYLRGLERSLEMVVKKLAKHKIHIVAVDTTKVDFIHNDNDLQELIKEILK